MGLPRISIAAKLLKEENKMDFQHHVMVVTKYIYAIVRGTICFWLGNIPYIFLLLNLFQAENADEIWTLLITGLVLIPFILAPSITACLAVTRKFFIQEDSSFPLLLTFITAYKKEYKKSVAIGIGFAVSLGLFLLSWQYYTRILGTTGNIFLVFSGLLSYMFLMVLNLINDQFLSIRDYIRNSFYLTIGYPFLSLTGMVEVALIFYITYLLSPSLLILVTPGTVLLLTTYLFRNLLKLEQENQQTNR